MTVIDFPGPRHGLRPRAPAPAPRTRLEKSLRLSVGIDTIGDIVGSLDDAHCELIAAETPEQARRVIAAMRAQAWTLIEVLGRHAP